MDLIFGKFVTTFNNFALGSLSSGAYLSQIEDFTYAFLGNHETCLSQAVLLTSIRLYFVYLFIAKFVLVYIHTVCVSIAAIRTTKALRQHFLQCLLRQEITFFDSRDAGSPSVRVTTNGNLVNNGTSNKLSMTIQSLSTFIAAFVVAFAVQWKLTLITICIVPVIIVATGICVAVDIKQEAGIMAVHSQAGVLAEEVFVQNSAVH